MDRRIVEGDNNELIIDTFSKSSLQYLGFNVK